MRCDSSLRSESGQAQPDQPICPKTSTSISMKNPNTTTLVVADTSGLMSLLVDTDANHHKALAQSQVFDESSEAVVIPSHDFSELMNVLGKNLGRQVAVAIGRQLSQTTYLIMESDADLTEALERFDC
jgi:hypothetical protein